MIGPASLGMGLGTLPILSDAETRSISAENPKGEKGAGATAENHLGVGWKGRPCITLPNAEATALAALRGLRSSGRGPASSQCRLPNLSSAPANGRS